MSEQEPAPTPPAPRTPAVSRRKLLAYGRNAAIVAGAALAIPATAATAAPDHPPAAGWDVIGADVPAHQAPQLADLVDRMRRGEPPRHTTADARRTTEFVTALYKSAATSRPVARGSITPDDPFHRSWWPDPTG
ncbi:hypothetical protein RVR_639 [Actinacidiphila reveromycinica]|uniref:Uncharacterized protein n=1 Tax=Actinacidiphila reveromycinica TaxID=659352 RepID=A0A7U3UNC0_9ACTN|nr:hypothetical protein [Streptomyces sp. SN-593]BBA95680.1 hypothetical protein RVR_639 [Streptomyces sp. SN-593]